MRTVVLYCLLFATLLPTVSSWGIIAHYNLNRDYIARVLCENRDRPQLHCDGKCFLAKRLKAQQDRQDKETTERVQRLPSMTLFCANHLPFAFEPTATGTAVPVFDARQPGAYRIAPDALFQPPRL